MRTNPFDHKATLDTSNYGSPTTDRTFGTGTGTQQDSGMPLYAARTIDNAAESAEDIVSDVFSPASEGTLATNRSNFLADVAAVTRPSLAN
jgi:hypothetical protein